MWNMCVASCVHPLIMCGFQCTDFSETHSQTVNICGYLLYQLTSEPDKEM